MALAKELGGIEAAAAKPGYITTSGNILHFVMGNVVKVIAGIPPINLVDLVAVMLDQVIKGFEKDSLMPDDLVRIVGTIPKAT